VHDTLEWIELGQFVVLAAAEIKFTPSIPEEFTFKDERNKKLKKPRK
jgi:hypothetical protein